MRLTNSVIVAFAVCAVFACSGCNIISVLCTPTIHEKKFPAEFGIADSSKKVVVLVDKAAGSNAGPDLAADLSVKINKWLIDKAGMEADLVVPVEAVELVRSQRGDFARLSPVEIGRICNAELVLYVLIADYGLYAMDGGRYYNGDMMTRSVIFDSSLDRAVWPREDGGKVVRVKVDLETKGHEAMDNRMLNATSHCIVRNLYDCPMDEYKIRDELPEFDDEKW